MTCTLCDLPTPDPPVTTDEVDGAYCCRGCLEVARTLDDAASADVDRVRDAVGDGRSDATAEGAVAYLTVEGMHCATCEAFLEGRAARHAGVLAAEASYPADMVKLTYDDAILSPADLPALLDGSGYRASDPGDAPDDDAERVGRLYVGGFFGMMTMLWYVLFLYPAYLGVPPDALLFDPAGVAGRYLRWNIWLMTSVVLGYTGYPLLRGAVVSLRTGHPNMDVLVSLAAGTAYLYSTVALLVGRVEIYFDIAVVVVLAVSVGGYYERRVKRRAADALTGLTESRVEEARRRCADGTETVPVEAVEVGDELVVEPGERLPVDGTVLEGTAAVDESLVTGESVPVGRAPGDSVIGGALVTDGTLVVRADEGANSTLDRLVAMLWDVQSTRPGTQRLADRLAAVFVPLVVALAVVATVWRLVGGTPVPEAILTGLAVLVVSCPCALGLATPLAVAAGVRQAMQAGVVVTDESVFETASETDVVVFDKTGTLTTGRMELIDWDGDDDALDRGAAVEQFSSHPVARAVTAHTDPPDVPVEAVERSPGRGVSALVDGERVVVGRLDLLEERGWTVPADLRRRYEDARADGDAPAAVGWNGATRGVLVARDTPRAGWERVVERLADEVDRVVVLTGDGEAATAPFRDHPLVDEVFADVRPAAKAALVERFRTEGTVAMVGDGSNDAPALAAADLGIAFESGTRLAADAADAVVTSDSLASVPVVFDLTRSTRRRVRENLGWAFCYNAVAVPLALAGLINPLFAAVAMATSSLLVVGNSTRPLLDAEVTGAQEDASAGVSVAPNGTDSQTP